MATTVTLAPKPMPSTTGSSTRFGAGVRSGTGSGPRPVLAPAPGGSSTRTTNVHDAAVSDMKSATITTAESSLSPKELELQRKRARDRKSQQAMRNRTKWTISNLTDQVTFLTQTVADRTRDVTLLNSRLRILETENAQLRAQNAALQLSLMGAGHPLIRRLDDAGSPPAVPSLPPKKAWEIPPLNSAPTCLSDQILQSFISTTGLQRITSEDDTTLVFQDTPNLCALLDKEHHSSDAISDIVGDIVRSYLEIDTLPKQVAVFYNMCCLLKWMILLDKKSWDAMPRWLRPTEAQITTPHAAWIDRIAWPSCRDYLIAHPEITLDHFAAVYSTSFSVRWPYDPSHVLIRTPASPPGGGVLDDKNASSLNPVYEEHLRQLRNWDVGPAFRDRYPTIAELVDRDGESQEDHLYGGDDALDYRHP